MWLAFRLFFMVAYHPMKSSGNSATPTGSNSSLRGGKITLSGALGARFITGWIAGGCAWIVKEEN
jgi:hypothetical protein